MRHPRGAGVVLAALVVVTLLGVAALQVTSARRHLLQGAADIQPVTAALQAPLTLRVPAARHSVRGRLVRAREEFAAGRRDLRIWTPLLLRLGWVPVIGPQLSSAPGAADAAYYSTAAAVHLLDGLAPVWPLASSSGHRGPLLLGLAAALQEGHAEFRAAQADAARAAGPLRALPVRTGSAGLDRASSRLRRNVPRLQNAALWLALAPSLLGAERPSHILVAWEDPKELRATGGFVGASDFLTVHRGTMTNAFYGRAPGRREVSSVLPPLPESAYTHENYLLFCDSNWSPDFPLTAQLERWFYGQDTGHWPATVVDILDSATPGMLRATGPVYLPEYRLWVNAGNLGPLAQRYVNGVYWGPNTHGDPDTLRKQFLADVVRALIRRIERLPADRWQALGAALADAVARRDIMLYDTRPGVEAAIRAIGGDGAIARPAGDYLFIVDDNRSYSKLNPYVRERARYQVDVRPDGRLDATLTVRYHVDPSPADLQGYGPGYGDLGTKHDYQDFLRVYVPRGSTLLGMRGLDRWAPKPAYGLTQFAGRLMVQEGRSATVRIRYRVPANVFLGDPGHYRLTVQHQPGANLRALSVRVQGAGGVSINGSGAAHVSLQRDAHLVLPLIGSLSPRPGHLPAPAAGDPYLPLPH